LSTPEYGVDLPPLPHVQPVLKNLSWSTHGAVGLWFLSSPAGKYLVSKSLVPPEPVKKLRFPADLCYHVVDVRIRLHEKNVVGVLTGVRGLQQHFVAETDKVAIKSRLSTP